MLLIFNLGGTRSVVSYLLIGAGVWVAVHASGVHATLAGVVVASTIPLRDAGRTDAGPLDLLRLASPPPDTTWRQLHGVALLCGIGFTMSLFIAALAFGEGSANDAMAKLGILIGSLVPASAGYVALRTAR